MKPSISRLYLHHSNGRGGGIRTHDPLRPRQVRYQAALRPDIYGFFDSTLLPAHRAFKLELASNRAPRIPTIRLLEGFLFIA